MTKPIFLVNDRVFHGQAHARVLECINQDDRDDVRLQGFRYYVAKGRQVWSVPEHSLCRSIPKK